MDTAQATSVGWVPLFTEASLTIGSYEAGSTTFSGRCAGNSFSRCCLPLFVALAILVSRYWMIATAAGDQHSPVPNGVDALRYLPCSSSAR
jgi:hypothetical protein